MAKKIKLIQGTWGQCSAQLMQIREAAITLMMQRVERLELEEDQFFKEVLTSLGLSSALEAASVPQRITFERLGHLGTPQYHCRMLICGEPVAFVWTEILHDEVTLYLEKLDSSHTLGRGAAHGPSTDK